MSEESERLCEAIAMSTCRIEGSCDGGARALSRGFGSDLAEELSALGPEWLLGVSGSLCDAIPELIGARLALLWPALAACEARYVPGDERLRLACTRRGAGPVDLPWPRNTSASLWVEAISAEPQARQGLMALATNGGDLEEALVVYLGSNILTLQAGVGLLAETTEFFHMHRETRSLFTAIRGTGQGRTSVPALRLV